MLVCNMSNLVSPTNTLHPVLTLRAYLRMNHRPIPGEAGTSSAWSRRLMAIGFISTMYGLIPTAISIALLATESRATPWPGWKTLHSTNNVVVYVPRRDWQSSSIQVAGVELRRWTTVTLDFVVFVLLGLTTDVKKMYWAPFRGVIEQTFSIGQTGCVIVSRS